MALTLTQLLSASVIVPVIAGTILFNRLPIYGRYITAFFYVSMITEIVSIIVAKAYGNNMVVFFFYASISAIVMGLCYSKLIGKNLLPLFCIVPLIALMEAVLDSPYVFNSYSFTTLNVVLLLAAMYCFYLLSYNLVDKGVVVFNLLLFFYSGSSTTFFFAAKFLQTKDLGMMMQFFGIHSWINCITNILFAISIWTLSKSYSSVQSFAR